MIEKDVLLATMIKYCDSKIVHVVKEALWVFSNLFAVSEELAWMAIECNVLETFIKYIDWDHNIKTEVSSPIQGANRSIKILYSFKKEILFGPLKPCFLLSESILYVEIP